MCSNCKVPRNGNDVGGDTDNARGHRSTSFSIKSCEFVPRGQNKRKPRS